MNQRRVSRILEPVTPDGKTEAGHDGYFLRNAVPHLFGLIGEGAGEIHPNDLPPKDRKDWFDGEARRIQIEKEMGRLIESETHRREMSLVVGAIMAKLESFPDLIERDAGATPEQVVMAEGIVQKTRELMYVSVSNLPD